MGFNWETTNSQFHFFPLLSELLGETRALKEGVIVGLANHTVLIAKDGTERNIDDSAAPIRRTDGEVAGCVLVFHHMVKPVDPRALMKLLAGMQIPKD